MNFLKKDANRKNRQKLQPYVNYKTAAPIGQVTIPDRPFCNILYIIKKI